MHHSRWLNSVQRCPIAFHTELLEGGYPFLWPAAELGKWPHSECTQKGSGESYTTHVRLQASTSSKASWAISPGVSLRLASHARHFCDSCACIQVQQRGKHAELSLCQEWIYGCLHLTALLAWLQKSLLSSLFFSMFKLCPAGATSVPKTVMFLKKHLAHLKNIWH